MKRFYRIFLFVVLLIFLSTFNPKELKLVLGNKDSFFSIKNIEIKNNLLIKQREIKEKLSQLYSKNIFFIKQRNIEDSLKDIDFLEKIEVKKKYPNTIIIKIFETKPVAIVLKNGNKYLLDSSSNMINFENKRKYSDLPNVFGNNAEKNFIFFLNKLKKEKFPNIQIQNYYYFPVGRWDIQFFDKKIIKFPSNNIHEAIIKSIELLKREDFKNYKIIDLRVSGKIIVE